MTEITTALTERKECALCGQRKLEVAITLPELPLTGIFSKEPMKAVLKGIDQQLLICNQCGHAQLANKIPAGMLYDDSYSFRTSTSNTARDGTNSFLSVLDAIAPTRHFKYAVDIGCNDLYLLRLLGNRTERRVGIDPLPTLGEGQKNDRDILLIESTIEDVDLDSALEIQPDLIVCRHTLEHIFKPLAVLQRLFNAAAPGALFLFEVPGFEQLVLRLRFDQIFHQHLHYFTLISFKRLLDEIGAMFISHTENYHDWGSMVIAFAKRDNNQVKRRENPLPLFDISEIRKRYAIFKRQMSTARDVLKSFEGTIIYGYGAAQMLPVLAYHLDNDLSLLTAVLDDDMDKDGLYYWNLPLAIRHASRIADLEEASVFITAIDNTKPILSKLMMRRPRHIIYPLHII